MYSKTIKFNYKKKEIFIDGEKLIPKVEGIISWGDQSAQSRLAALNLLGHYVHASSAFASHIKFTEEVIGLIPQKDYELDESIISKWIIKNCKWGSK